VRSCWKLFLVSGVFKLLADLCGLLGPLSISYIVEFVNSQVSPATATTSSSGAINDDDVAMNTSNFHNKTTTARLMDEPSWSEFIANGWIMSGIVLIAFLLQGTLSQASTNLINMEGIKIKNALQGLIYRKTLSLSASCFHSTSKAATKTDYKSTAGSTQLKEEQVEDDDYDLNDPGTITNLMSDDALNIMTFFWICHYVWSIPLKVSHTAGALWRFNCVTIKVINSFIHPHKFHYVDCGRRVLFVPKTWHEFVNWVFGDHHHDAAVTIPCRS
jgi:ABC-type multidrug transport system fused ATPase/permease subunit